MKPKKYFFLVCLTVMLALSGCSAVLDGNTMLRPPRATGDKAEIQNIISQQAGGKYTFKYPQTGEYRSAITMKTEKAVNEFANYLLGYIPYLDEPAYNEYTKEIMELYGLTEPPEFNGRAYTNTRNLFPDSFARLYIEKYLDESIRTEIRQLCRDVADTYDEMLIEDVTGDDVSDIVLLSLSTQKNPSNFKVLQYSETEKKPVARYAVELDPETINFANITFGTIAQNQKGVVIDGEKNGGILSSQIIFFDENSNTFLNPLVTENENGTFSNPTARKDTIYSRDADGDSIIETPVVTPLPAPTENTSLNICSITAWKQYSVYNKALGTKINTVINYNDRYYITVPNRWINNTITAVTDTDTRKMTFYIWNSKTSSFGDKLLEISRYTKDEFANLDQTNIIRLNIENPNAVFCAEIFITNADDGLNITVEEVLNSVHEFWKN